MILVESAGTLLSERLYALFWETHLTVGYLARRTVHKAELYATASMAFQATS